MRKHLTRRSIVAALALVLGLLSVPLAGGLLASVSPASEAAATATSVVNTSVPSLPGVNSVTPSLACVSGKVSVGISTSVASTESASVEIGLGALPTLQVVKTWTQAVSPGTTIITVDPNYVTSGDSFPGGMAVVRVFSATTELAQSSAQVSAFGPCPPPTTTVPTTTQAPTTTTVPTTAPPTTVKPTTTTVPSTTTTKVPESTTTTKPTTSTTKPDECKPKDNDHHEGLEYSSSYKPECPPPSTTTTKPTPTTAPPTTVKPTTTTTKPTTSTTKPDECKSPAGVKVNPGYAVREEKTITFFSPNDFEMLGKVFSLKTAKAPDVNSKDFVKDAFLSLLARQPGFGKEFVIKPKECITFPAPPCLGVQFDWAPMDTMYPDEAFVELDPRLFKALGLVLTPADLANLDIAAIIAKIDWAKVDYVLLWEIIMTPQKGLVWVYGANFLDGPECPVGPPITEPPLPPVPPIVAPPVSPPAPPPAPVVLGGDLPPTGSSNTLPRVGGLLLFIGSVLAVAFRRQRARS